jgi:CheY-like chemotaxis protein
VGPISGDPDRLQQIVWNLLTNSVKFTNKGGRIEVSLRADGADAVLRVKDSGIGIAPDLLPHVFERFRQGVSSPSRVHGGLGIGLALVRHIAEMHGGSVAAESDGDGKGSAFTLRIPMMALRSSPERPVLTPGDPPDASKTRALSEVKVLVVDDDQDARDLIATTLHHAGANVSSASTMQEALEVIRAQPPQAVVSDIAMPSGTGYDLIGEMRKMPGLATIPAIALTAYGRVEDRDCALAAGFNFHVTKPVDPHQLVQILSEALRR